MYRAIKENPNKYTFDFKGRLMAVKVPILAIQKVINPAIFIDN